MHPTFRSPGFTLIELMVSIAIALVLILGINMVFKTTAQTVGAGNGVLAAARDARTVGATLLADLNQVDAVPEPATPTIGDAPCFIIRSQHTYAFRNPADFAEATSPSDPSTDTNVFANTTIFPNNQAPVPYVNFRSHRIDKLAFFIRGNLFRQTSSDVNSYTSNTGSNEAWVVWGHGMQPNNAAINALTKNPGAALTSSAMWFGPGDASIPGTGGATNDNNFYASDWILTRSATLLVPSPSDPDYIVDPYASSTPAGGARSPIGGLQPLAGWPPATTGSFTATASSNLVNNTSLNGKPYYLNQSRLDIANTSIENWGSKYRQNPSTSKYDGIASYNPAYAGTVDVNGNPYYSVTASNNPDWWDPLINYRPQVSPYLLPDPASTAVTPKITPYGLALCAPALIRGCSQFIVEYTGNYYTKKVTGFPNANSKIGYSATTSLPIPDPAGTLDFYTYQISTQYMRGIRWYGFPRSVNPQIGATVVPTVRIGGTISGSSNGDVIPLRDFLCAFSPSLSGKYIWAPVAQGGVNPADAERFNVTNAPTTPTWPSIAGAVSTLSSLDYWSQPTMPPNDAPTSPMANGIYSTYPYTYTAAWGPDTRQPFPKMIRIIIGIDDHEGRINQPQMFEYVFNVSP